MAPFQETFREESRGSRVFQEKYNAKLVVTAAAYTNIWALHARFQTKFSWVLHFAL